MSRLALALSAVAALAGCRLDDAPPAPPAPVAALDSASADLQADTSGASPADSSRAAPRVDVAAAPTTTAPSGLVIPVAGVAAADLQDTFDDARSEGRIHDAIDIHAPRGTPVVAAAAGTVARLFTSERGGLTVYVVSPPALPADTAHVVYYYAHLDAYAAGLAAGQAVRAGQPLGTVGDTGNAVPGDTHLHFAIWTVPDPARFWDGPELNPYPLLTGGR